MSGGNVAVTRRIDCGEDADYERLAEGTMTTETTTVQPHNLDDVIEQG